MTISTKYMISISYTADRRMHTDNIYSCDISIGGPFDVVGSD